MYFECIDCASSTIANPTILRCPDCNSPLIINYDASQSNYELPKTITLGEGNTSIIELTRFSQAIGITKVYAKLENTNPTGSFKDRGSSVMIGAISSAGIKDIVEDSSGNAGASVAAYAARANISTHIFVPESAPKAKIDQITVYGATVHKVPGHRDNATKKAHDFVSQTGFLYASHNINPYFLEGTKSFAFELVDQLKNNLPDHIVIPVGNGSLLIATYLTLKHLKNLGSITRVPKLHAIQSERFMPIVAEVNDTQWQFDQNATTVACGIASSNPPRLKQILTSINEFNGSAASVTEESILGYRSLLAESEGIYMEPTSSAAFAGLHALADKNIIGPSDTVLIPVTGNGLKDSN